MKKSKAILYLIVLSTLAASQNVPDTWVTLETAALDTVMFSLSEEGINMEVHSAHPADTVSIVRLAREDLPFLTNIFHDRFDRCGGYRVHHTLEDAQEVNCYIEKCEGGAFRAKGVTYTIDNGDAARALRDATTEPHIVETITHLTSFDNRFYDSSEGVAASNWLRSHWASLTAGRDDVTVSQVAHSGFPQQSVVLTFTGTELSNEVVVLGGHLDSTLRSGGGPSPGADDDASGVACVTEVIRVMVETGFRPRRSVHVMAYAGEEHGLLGSEAIADSYAAQNINVVAALQLDMTNYNGSTEDLWLVQDFTDGPLNTFAEQLIDTYLPGITRSTTRCGYPCSDHASWTFAGYPAMFPFESRFGSHNPNYHTSGDTLAVTGGQALHALKFARFASVFVAEIAGGTPQGGASDFQLAQVNLLTMANLITGLGACESPDCPRDLDDDGDVDQADLMALTAFWREEQCLGFVHGLACP